jgi:predicted Zn-dependent protease with MMP-like domain
MDRKRFEELVIKAIDGLPEEFREQMDNVDVVIEDLPSGRQAKRMRLRNGFQLLGLYEGIPQIERGSTTYGLVLPDKITIFQKSVEAVCSNDDQVENEVREVVKHEIAHHFGITDAKLAEIERNKRKQKKKR